MKVHPSKDERSTHMTLVPACKAAAAGDCKLLLCHITATWMPLQPSYPGKQLQTNATFTINPAAVLSCSTDM